MTFGQIQRYVIGLVKGVFPNAGIINKITADEEGVLYYKGTSIASAASSSVIEEVVNNSFPNKSVLSELTLSSDNTLTYGNSPVSIANLTVDDDGTISIEMK